MLQQMELDDLLGLSSGDAAGEKLPDWPISPIPSLPLPQICCPHHFAEKSSDHRSRASSMSFSQRMSKILSNVEKELPALMKESRHGMRFDNEELLAS